MEKKEELRETNEIKFSYKKSNIDSKYTSEQLKNIMKSIDDLKRKKQ
jgi:hypothetical protein